MTVTLPKVWLITGASRGFGLALASTALQRGDRVIVTSRTTDALSHLTSNPNCRILQLDVAASVDEIRAKAAHAVGFWGRIDVLVNNAATSFNSSWEEAGADIYKECFATNFFGVINVTNAFLPYMREKRKGTVVNMGSRSAWRTRIPNFGPYTSSKAALRAASDGLSAEVAPFNIRVLLVEPGGLRTECLKQAIDSATSLEARASVIPEYESMRETTARRLKDADGSQPGDPQKAANIIADVVRGEGCAEGREWPLCLVIGDDAVKDILVKCDEMTTTMRQWKDVASSIALDVTSS